MNKVLLSIGGIILITGVGSLLGNFFGIKMIYILPFIGWFIALIIFYLMLDETQTNSFMLKLNELNEN